MSEAIRGTFLSATGATLDKLLWMADGEERGVVQLVHGMAEHIDRYDETAKRLNTAGYTVVGHTQLGHGAGADIKGFFSDKDGWDAVVEDVHALRKATQKKKVPYFLLGHSMGSFVVRTYCLQHEQGLAGVVLSGTGHFDKGIVTAGKMVAGLQNLFGMNKKSGKLLDKMNFAANNKAFENPRTPFDWLSRDTAQVDKYIEDAYCGFTFTVGGYRDMFEGLSRLYAGKLDTMVKDIPVLVFSGDHDPVGKNGEGIRKVVQELKDAGIQEVTLKLYTDGRHEMFNEINREEVCADLVSWMNGVGGKKRIADEVK